MITPDSLLGTLVPMGLLAVTVLSGHIVQAITDIINNKKYVEYLHDYQDTLKKENKLLTEEILRLRAEIQDCFILPSYNVDSSKAVGLLKDQQIRFLKDKEIKQLKAK